MAEHCGPLTSSVVPAQVNELDCVLQAQLVAGAIRDMIEGDDENAPFSLGSNDHRFIADLLLELSRQLQEHRS